MKKTLTFKESIVIGSMLFGMFFGAGNLIFPVHMGQLAGTNFWPAVIGFIITGVGLPLLGVTCLATSNKNSLFELSSLVGDKFKYFFTVLLYLTIGPFFAIPRCATTSFTIGITPLLNGGSEIIPRLIFTFLFFSLALFFVLKPNNIMDYIGKIINPIFLIFLIILIAIAFINPMLRFNNITPHESYMSNPLFKGILEGYNTMDAIASLAFGITIISVVKNLGITNEQYIASSIIKAGLIGCGLMAIIYILTTYMGVMSRGEFMTSDNGGIALSQISNYYFGSFGIIFLLIVVTLACFKTSIALIISCSEIFSELFPNTLSFKKWAYIFTGFSFVISNFGLNAIITYAVPVLMFIYPIAICLILLSLFGKVFNYDKKIFSTTILFTTLAAIFDFIVSFPRDSIIPNNFIDIVSNVGNKILPFFSIGFGWFIPALIGLIIGFSISKMTKD